MFIYEAVRTVLFALIAFLAAILMTPLWYRVLTRLQFKKQIRTSEEAPIFSSYHQKKEGTPTGGGIIIWTTVLGLAIIFWILSKFFGDGWMTLNFINRAETYLPLVALAVAAVLGLADDWLGILKIGSAKGGGLQIRYKLLMYAVIAAIAASWFYFRLQWDILWVPFVGNITIGPWYIPLFMFVVIASAFSANETDGLDGLLGGVALFAFVALATIAFVLRRYDLAAFDGAMVGALLAFLWYNIFPAKFFMGDTGSMSLGITIGVIAMLTNTALLLPLFAIIMVLESLSVILQMLSKKIRGKKLFLSTPIHHHFEALGWPESQVTMRFWIISAMGSILGLVIFFVSHFLQ